MSGWRETDEKSRVKNLRLQKIDAESKSKNKTVLDSKRETPLKLPITR